MDRPHRGFDHHLALDAKCLALYIQSMKSIVSSKGQITLPAEAREKLGLLPGTPISFEIREGSLVLRKGSRGVHPVDAVFGTLKVGRPVDELIDDMRGPRPSTGRRRVRRR